MEDDFEREIDFEEQMVLIEMLYDRIRTYRALLKIQKRLMDRLEIKLFKEELTRLRREIESWM